MAVYVSPDQAPWVAARLATLGLSFTMAPMPDGVVRVDVHSRELLGWLSDTSV